MNRVLVFDGEKGPKRFELCRIAVLGAGDGKGGRGKETVRSEARILDAMDTISDLMPGGDEGTPDARLLKPEGGTITLAQPDFALLELYLDATPWLPRAARAAVDAQDWLSASEKVGA